MPDVIVNAAAYTNVEKAEVEQDLAFTVNGHALVNICEEIDNFNRKHSRDCLLYTSPSPRDMRRSRMPSSA